MKQPQSVDVKDIAVAAILAARELGTVKKGVSSRSFRALGTFRRLLENETGLQVAKDSELSLNTVRGLAPPEYLLMRNAAHAARSTPVSTSIELARTLKLIFELLSNTKKIDVAAAEMLRKFCLSIHNNIVDQRRIAIEERTSSRVFRL